MLAVVAAVIIGGILKITRQNAHQTVYLNGMNRAYRLAESGMNEAAGRLVIEPRNLTPMTGSTSEGIYESVITQTDNVLQSGYYIVTSATHTSQGRTFSSRLHTHLRISNVGDYFAAVADILPLGDGIDVSEGRIYSPKLKFMDEGVATPTRVKSAEFVTSCDPPIDWTAGDKAAIVLAEPTYPGQAANATLANQPTKLNSLMVFPQVTEGDLIRFKTLANVHNGKNFFSGDIFPPGYQAGGCAQLSGDTYSAHTCDNLHHVYYSTDDIHLQGVVHGQVLFVSEKNIFITGSLSSAPDSDPLPGATLTSSSTAHQAVLITRENVVIDKTFYTGTPVTEYIQALIMAPHGALLAEPYNLATFPGAHANLSLNFKGSMILGSLPTSGGKNIGTVFQGGRTYGYMESLKTNPPPFIPAIIDVYYALEETGAGPGVYTAGSFDH